MDQSKPHVTRLVLVEFVVVSVSVNVPAQLPRRESSTGDGAVDGDDPHEDKRAAMRNGNMERMGVAL
jgi:hypothetical protein